MTGREFDAEEAFRIGFANRLAPTEELDATLDDLIAELLKGFPVPAGLAKRVMDASARPAIAQTLEQEVTGSSTTPLLILFGAVWLALYLARRITTPLRLVAEGAERIASGERGVRVDFPSGSAFRNTCQRYLGCTPHQIRVKGGAGWVMCLARMAITLSPSNGSRPVSM